MLFNSFPFVLFFMPVVLAIALRLRGQALLRWIALSSFVFYSFAGHAWFVIPMLVTTVLDFYLAPRIATTAKLSTKRMLLGISLVGNLGLLFYFKYSGLFLTTAERAYSLVSGGAAGARPEWMSIFDVVLPAGISFYTFQTLAYIIDVYRGRAHAETNFWKFAGFVSFFPHLVAGPLTRHNQLIPQLDRIAQTRIKPRWEEGIYLFAVGLAKKVLVADTIASYLHPIIGDAEHMTMTTAWLALFGFTLQIYFDFSGYSDMAIGLGRLFDIELPINFNSPYKATDPSDFWRRWHITLSQWLRDYLYISLGGNRCSEVRRNFNLFATMVLGGLWHGASWTFAVWGAYHGVLLVGFHRLEKYWSTWPIVIQRALTLFLVMIGWVFFRARTFPEAMTWLTRLCGVGSDPAVTLTTKNLYLAAFVVGGLVLVNFFPNAVGHKGLGTMRPVMKAALGVIALLAILRINYSSAFLYFQF